MIKRCSQNSARVFGLLTYTSCSVSKTVMYEKKKKKRRPLHKFVRHWIAQLWFIFFSSFLKYILWYLHIQHICLLICRRFTNSTGYSQNSVLVVNVIATIFSPKFVLSQKNNLNTASGCTYWPMEICIQCFVVFSVSIQSIEMQYNKYNCWKKYTTKCRKQLKWNPFSFHNVC